MMAHGGVFPIGSANALRLLAERHGNGIPIPSVHQLVMHTAGVSSADVSPGVQSVIDGHQNSAVFSLQNIAKPNFYDSVSMEFALKHQRFPHKIHKQHQNGAADNSRNRPISIFSSVKYSWMSTSVKNAPMQPISSTTMAQISFFKKSSPFSLFSLG
jgi:hypothetical protein